MDVAAYNRQAWDKQVTRGNRWTVPVTSAEVAAASRGDWQIILTPEKPVPRAWFGDVADSTVLCLAGSGGQQAPLLAAAGARVTVLDNSPNQLGQDRLVAERDSLEIRTVLGDMRDLSAFRDGEFDLIVNPCSVSFVPEVRPVWRECRRVLRPGGAFLGGFINPAAFVFDGLFDDDADPKLRFKLPYTDETHLTDAEKAKLIADDEPFMFSHSLDDLLGGLIDAGFVIAGFFEDDWTGRKISEYLPTFLAVRAVAGNP